MFPLLPAGRHWEEGRATAGTDCGMAGCSPVQLGGGGGTNGIILDEQTHLQKLMWWRYKKEYFSECSGR